jgi:hypothetical protein
VARLGLFAYGSLVSPDSAARTIGRAVEAAALARLPGMRRRWSTFRDNHACEKTFARPDGSLPAHVLGLNLEPSDDPAMAPNGALLELSDDELRRLDLREMRYLRFAVGERLDEMAEDFDEVFAYRAKPEHHAPDPPQDAIVIASYARFVEEAFDALGPGQRELYVETTGPPPVEIADAVLVTDRAIPAGNPREW